MVGIVPESMGNNTRKLKLCIIMHNYAKYAFFESWIKTTFLCISDDFKHFLFFHLKYFFRDLENFPVCGCTKTGDLSTVPSYQDARDLSCDSDGVPRDNDAIPRDVSRGVPIHQQALTEIKTCKLIHCLVICIRIVCLLRPN